MQITIIIKTFNFSKQKKTIVVLGEINEIQYT